MVLLALVRVQSLAFAGQYEPSTEKAHESINISLIRGDISISSAFGYKDFYFVIAPSWELLPGSFLNLFISHSSSVNPSLSNLTIFLNGLPIYSNSLDKTNTWTKSIEIPLPENNLREGINVLEVKSLLRTTDDTSAEASNPANWLKIHSETYVNIKYLTKKTIGVKDFPSPFFEKNVPKEDVTAFVIPKSWSPQEIEAIFKIVLDWIADSSPKELAPLILTIDKVNNEIKDRYNLIYIGIASNFPPEVLKEFDVDKYQLKGNIAISSLISENKKARLLITSEEGEGVIKGALALLSPEIKRQIDGNKVYLPLKMAFKSTKEKQTSTGNTIYFDDLIKRDIVFKGAFSHTDAIAINIPPNWATKGKPSIVINFRHSQSLNAKKSALTVLINSIPVNSVELSPQNANDGRMTIIIPQDFIDQGFIYVTFNAFLALDITNYSYSYPEIAWLVIEKSSFFNIPHETRKVDAILERFPYAITEDPVYVYIGDDINSIPLNTLLYCLIGIQRQINQQLDVRVFKLESLREKKLEEEGIKNIIVLASYEEVEKASLKPYIEKVPIVPSFAEKATLCSLDNYKGEIASLTISWLKEHPIINPFYEKALTTWNLKGNLCLISTQGEVVPFYLSQAPPKNIAKRSNQSSFWTNLLTELKQSRTLTGVFVLTLVVILTTAILILVKQKNHS